MRYSPYQASPDRYNPQFIGIAKRFSTQKRTRMISQHRRHQLDTQLIYNSNLDSSLDKQLQAKQKQLARLQQARQRHNNQLRQKEEMEERRREELRKMVEKNNQSRMRSKMNIQQAREGWMKNNRLQQTQQTQLLGRQQRKLKQHLHKQMKLKDTQYQTMRQDQRQAHKRIDYYYRHRNQQSFNNYLQRIKQQSYLKRKHQKSIVRNQKKLKVLSRTLDAKQNHVMQLQEEIDGYKTERVVNWRKSMGSSLSQRQSSVEKQVQQSDNV